MKDYNLGTLNPGQTREINAAGDYVRNIGQGSILVEAANDKAKAVKAFKTVIGAGGARSPKSEYTQWQITNNALVAIDVSVLIGEGDASENDVQISADVNSISETKNKTNDLTQFVDGGFESDPSGFVAGVLLNPVGSGVVANLNTMKGSATALNIVNTFRVTEAQVTAAGVPLLTKQGANKYLGAPDSKCRVETFAAILAGSALPSAALDSTDMVMAELLNTKECPIVIPEGFAVCLMAFSTGLYWSLEWEEI